MELSGRERGYSITEFFLPRVGERLKGVADRKYVKGSQEARSTEDALKMLAGSTSRAARAANAELGRGGRND
jgi:hypothetical protein